MLFQSHLCPIEALINLFVCLWYELKLLLRQVNGSSPENVSIPR